jgi:hypothetical protein
LKAVEAVACIGQEGAGTAAVQKIQEPVDAAYSETSKE